MISPFLGSLRLLEQEKYSHSAPMLIEIGHVEAIYRYPVKSMCGERLEAARSAGTASTAADAWPYGEWMTAAGFRS